jgi:hypothetical protein
MDIGTRNSQAAYAQVRASELVGLESLLRTTLRALAVCAVRQSDRETARQLVLRARDIADRLTSGIDDLDESVAGRDARATADHLAKRLDALERIVEGRATLLS